MASDVIRVRLHLRQIRVLAVVALVSEPLRGVEQRFGPLHPLGVGAAVGGRAHREGTVAASNRRRGHDEGRDQLAGAELDDLDVELQAGIRGERGDVIGPAGPQQRTNAAAAAGVCQRAAGDDSRAPAHGNTAHARAGGEPLDRPVPPHARDMGVGRIDRGGDDHTDFVSVVNGADLPHRRA